MSLLKKCHIFTLNLFIDVNFYTYLILYSIQIIFLKVQNKKALKVLEYVRQTLGLGVLYEKNDISNLRPTETQNMQVR